MNPRKTIVITAIISLLMISSAACKNKYPTAIATGTWHYTLLMNGVKIGTAVTSTQKKENQIRSEVEMTMELGAVKNRTRQIITETTDFRPLKLEIYNDIINGDKVQKVATIAEVKGKEIHLSTGGHSAKVKITKDFVFDGTYFMSRLIAAGFKEGTRVSSYLYEPTFEVEEPILVSVTMAGRERVTINGKSRNLIHLVQVIENFKNIDIYIDDNGVAQKAVILMLNNKIELIIDETK